PHPHRNKEDLKTIIVVNGDERQQRKEQHEEEDNIERMARLEERLHVFELLFQAYYINDEVFRSLDDALRADMDTARKQRQGRRYSRPRFAFLNRKSDGTI